MTDLKSQILSEVEENLGSGYVQMMNDAMEKCPALALAIYTTERNYESKEQIDDSNKSIGLRKYCLVGKEIRNK